MSPEVLHVIASLQTGGAQSVLLYLLRAWEAQDRYRFSVATVLPGGQFLPAVRDVGVPVVELGVERPYDPRALRHLRKVIEARRPAIIHCHLFYANLYAALANRGDGHVPLVYTEHSIWNRRRRSSLFRPFDRWLAHQYDQVIAVTDVAAQRFLAWTGYDDRRLAIIPNGIEIGRFPPDVDPQAVRREWGIPDDLFVFLLVGRLVPAKGVEHLLRAARQSAEAGRRCAVLIVGDGPLREELEAQAEEEQLSRTVRFLGEREDAPALMTAADAFILSSVWEALPLAMLEAMACGKPVIATSVGGVPEVVRDGVEGLLVPPGDADSLAEAMTRMMDMPAETLAQMGRRARRRVEEGYNITRSAQAILSIYDTLLQPKAGEI